MSQTTIYLSRGFTLNRNGHDPVELKEGRNTVDADVAKHDFVKAHTVDAAPDRTSEVDALTARVAELEALVAEKDAALAELQGKAKK